jgi:acyl dehydratase
MAEHTVVARNWATESSNRIHADDVAALYGFRGGLVPGVTTIAYLVPAVVAALGREWLEGGRLNVRLSSPVYDGETVIAYADDLGLVRMVGASGDDDRVSASASLDHEPAPDRGSFPVAAVPPHRPPAGPDTLAVGTALGTLHHEASDDAVARYLSAINEQPFAAGIHALHPGWLLLDANDALAKSVVLGPWIHVGSDLHLLRPVRSGESLEVRSIVTAEYERKGHRLIELDVLTLAAGEPALLVHHTAIYQLRPAAA